MYMYAAYMYSNHFRHKYVPHVCHMKRFFHIIYELKYHRDKFLKLITESLNKSHFIRNYKYLKLYNLLQWDTEHVLNSMLFDHGNVCIYELFVTILCR